MRHALLGLSMALAVVLSVSVAQAGPTVQVGDVMYFDNWSGGSFKAEPTGASNFTPFPTFCVYLEGTLYVNGGSGYSYQVTGLGTTNSAPTPMSMTTQTAYLYTSFLNGSLPGFTDTLAQEEALQYGIWSSMGYTDAQLAAHGGLLDGNLAQAESDFVTLGWNVTPVTWSGFGNVEIASLNSLSGNNPAQDILVIETTPVPEPAAMGLLGIGLVGLIAVKRPRHNCSKKFAGEDRRASDFSRLADL